MELWKITIFNGFLYVYQAGYRFCMTASELEVILSRVRTLSLCAVAYWKEVSQERCSILKRLSVELCWFLDVRNSQGSYIVYISIYVYITIYIHT